MTGPEDSPGHFEYTLKKITKKTSKEMFNELLPPEALHWGVEKKYFISFWNGLGMIWRRFWYHFGMILVSFWDDIQPISLLNR